MSPIESSPDPSQFPHRGAAADQGGALRRDTYLRGGEVCHDVVIICHGNLRTQIVVNNG